DPLFRLLRALASVGVFAEGPSRTFSLTPTAQLLRSDVPGSQRSLARMAGGQQFAAWSEILHSLRTGETAYQKLYGRPVFDALADDPANARIFDEAMTGIHGRESDAVLDVYDFSGIGTLVDVGGGNGGNLIATLERHPQMRGILFDLPHVVERARPRVEAAGLSNRCQLVGGSFFESVPPGGDAYLMRHIIHDWYDEQSLTILRNCHKALPAGGRVLVIESVIPPGNDPFPGKFLDLTMLLIPGGKERTAEEYRTLYEQSGFELARIIPTTAEVSVIEGVKR
ncbi:MAG: methyltransferase, partial [Planctomycetaceae bacterium]|nr:methyltransferase [Planctomycetaceae bacterium]